jgi:3-hydroxybutyrate dehydrogenase
MKGKRALVTGAASGIGLAVARELAAQGAEVIVSDLPGEALKEAAASVPRARMIAADLARAPRALATEAGEVDILVNNAGIQHVSPIEELDPARWETILAIMLTAPFLLLRDLLPGMYARGWGRVVNVGSVHSLVASPFKAAYVSAKHGLMGLTKTAALEAGPKGVTVNCVCPSYVRTPLVEKQIASQARVHGMEESEVVSRVMLDRNAIKRLIEPREVARTVAFLCTEEAWSITGAAITMDGGWLAH